MDTNIYLIAGLVVILGILAGYVISLRIRAQNLKKKADRKKSAHRR